MAGVAVVCDLFLNGLIQGITDGQVPCLFVSVASKSETESLFLGVLCVVGLCVISSFASR